jgi:hypothetical protein
MLMRLVANVIDRGPVAGLTGNPFGDETDGSSLGGT